MGDCHALWSRVLEVIATSSTPAIQSFFAGVRPVGLQHDRLIVRVDSPLVADWLRQRYRASIEAALQQLCQRALQLVVECAPHGAVTPVTPPPDEPPAPLSPSARTLPPPRPPATINPAFRFDTFVIGSSNQMAHAAAYATAQQPGKVYNPLFMYGGVGLGKTHLMQAIGHAVLQRQPRDVVHFISCERFTNQYIDALQNHTLSKFRDFFRANVDVLLIDDIQFLSNKERLQEEFYHTFNDLHMQGKQIVMTSDKSPQELQHIEQRMVNRFESGMVVDVQSPDFETRVAIIQKKLEQYGTQLDHDVCYYLANKVRNDVRKIEGALVKLLGYASVRHQAVTLDLARECLRGYVAAQCVTLDAIQKAVSDFFDVRIADLRSSKRPRAIVHPRQIAMYLCRELTTSSLTDIAQSFGGKDHTTVLYACRKIEQVKEQDEMINQQLHALKRRLGSSEERCEQVQ
ncbi:MAG: chromosomal replication initiator protein DnaA [bacterium]|nr:chromosomal replication initiator protein DnaA [bacterium]